MEPGYVFGQVDAAELAVYAFFAFFFGLVFFIQRESRREGFPLIDEKTGKEKAMSWIFLPTPKVYRMANGHTHMAPAPQGEDRQVALRSVNPREFGNPYVPTGNPFLDGVGPAAWAPREDIPDTDHEGHPKIVPMKNAPDFSVVSGDPDLRGCDVWAMDRRYAGTVSEIWVDRAESLIRYLEVEVPTGASAPAPAASDDGDAPASMGASAQLGRKVLLPMTMVRLRKRRGKYFVMVGSITSEQFKDVPTTASPSQVTRLEEEKIMAYYGGGYLYAHAKRGEPLL
ncbi:MAG: photosynthetic reaction center subunit H [Alphaproteobacteria bacterium]